MPPIPPSEIIMAEYTSLLSIFAELRRDCQSILRTVDTFMEDINSLRDSFHDSGSDSSSDSDTNSDSRTDNGPNSDTQSGSDSESSSDSERSTNIDGSTDSGSSGGTAPPIPSVMAITTRKVTMIQMR